MKLLCNKQKRWIFGNWNNGDINALSSANNVKPGMAYESIHTSANKIRAQVIKRNYAFPGAAIAWKCDNATPVFFFGHTGPGTRPGPLHGPGGLAYGPEDNSDMERVDGSGPASPPPANLSGSILVFLDLEPAPAARRDSDCGHGPGASLLARLTGASWQCFAGRGSPRPHDSWSVHLPFLGEVRPPSPLYVLYPFYPNYLSEIISSYRVHAYVRDKWSR
jgi:hypothetical protein